MMISGGPGSATSTKDNSVNLNFNTIQATTERNVVTTNETNGICERFNTKPSNR